MMRIVFLTALLAHAALAATPVIAELRPRGVMDGRPHRATRQERRIRGVDDGIDGQRGDVAAKKLDGRHAPHGTRSAAACCRPGLRKLACASSLAI